MNFKLWLENEVFYHGSNSPEINGPIRTNERDAGWFGQGFYATLYPDYAKRWGEHVYKITIPEGIYANATVIGNYQEIQYDPIASEANEFAGGHTGWIENEYLWAKKFTDYLKQKNVTGIKVHFDNKPNTEIIVFNPDQVKILGKLN